MAFYHTTLTVHKAVTGGQPAELSGKFSTDYPYCTRQATGGRIRMTEDQIGRSKRSQGSFSYRGAAEYNRIPADIRQAQSISTFKLKLKKWIHEQIPVK